MLNTDSPERKKPSAGQRPQVAPGGALQASHGVQTRHQRCLKGGKNRGGKRKNMVLFEQQKGMGKGGLTTKTQGSASNPGYIMGGLRVI